MFSDEDIEGALKPVTDILPRLDSAKRKAMSYFNEVDKNDLEECILLFQMEKTREAFYTSYRDFVKCYEILMPDPLTNKYKEDIKFLSKVYQAVLNRFRETMNLEGCGDKVRKLIAEYIEAIGVKNIIKPVSILDKDFDKQYTELKSDKSKASEIEQAISHTININMQNDPVYYETLRERLDSIIKKNKENWETMVKELEGLKEDIRTEYKDKANELGLDIVQMSFYNMIKATKKEAIIMVKEFEEDDTVAEGNYAELAKELVKVVKEESYIDWVGNDHKTRMLRLAIINNEKFKQAYDDREFRKIVTNKIIETLAKVHFKK